MANDGSSHRSLTFPVTIFSHLSVVSIATLVLYWLLKLREGVAFSSNVKLQIVNLHPLLTILGLIIFSGEAIITYNGIPATIQTLERFHPTFHLTALFAGILGVYAVFKFYNELNIAHMYTLHSWIGMSTICLFVLQWLLGFVPGCQASYTGQIRPVAYFYRCSHIFLAIVTAETGLMELFIFHKLQTEAQVVNFIGLLTLAFGISVGLTVVLPLKRH